MSTEQWTEVFTAQFGRGLTGEEAAAWDQEFRAAFPDIKGAEIIAAIRLVAGGWERNAFCGARDILTRIRDTRSQRKEQTKSNKSGCAMCDDGFISYLSLYESDKYPNGPMIPTFDKAYESDPRYICFPTCIACMCEVGEQRVKRQPNGMVEFNYNRFRQQVYQLKKESRARE